MHLYDAIEEYNFTHGKHFDTATGQYDLLMPHDLGRPLTHEEMDYNFLYQKQTMNGFRIFGSGTNYKLSATDLNKVLKFHQITPADADYAIYTGAGYVDNQFIWIPVEMAAAAQPAYVTLTANPTTINETGNSTVTFTLNVVNVDDNTTVDWSIATGSGITAGDFVGGLTGTATINSNQATWTVQAAADNFTEGPESFTLTLASTDSAGNDTTTQTGNALSATVAISDTSITPVYNSISSANSVNEGASITFTVNTSNFFQAATADWLVDFANSTATSADFTGATSGTVNLDANGDGTFSVAIANDLINDNENFTVKLTGNDSNGINTNEISKNVTINNAVFPTYTTFTGPATRLEGQNAQYALQGTNIPNGTQVGYTITGVDLSDISLSSLTGFITMNSNFGQLFFTCLEDNTVDGPDTMVVTLNNVDSAGNTTGLTPTLSVSTVISDVAPTYEILGQSPIIEGETQTYTFRASNMVAGTTVYWELRNFGDSNFYTEFADDLSTPRTGSGQVQTVGNNVELDFDITVVNDMTSSEGSEYFKIVVWDDASNYATGPNFDGAVSGALATKDITISDLNPQWQITTATNNQSEPGTLSFNILTRYVMAGQTYTWAASPNGGNPASGADFQGGSFPSGSGTVSTFNNTLSVSGTFTTEIIADNTTEGTEQYKVELTNQQGAVVATKIINVTDDSQTPQGEIHWLHWSSNSGYPSGSSLIVEPAGGWYLNNNTQTSDFSAVWADMVANQGTANNVPVIENFQMLGSGLTQSSIPNGTIGFNAIAAANRYYIAIPQSVSGDPSSTALFQLPDSANADIIFSGRIAFQISGVDYWLYDVGLTASADALNLNLKNA